MTLDYEQFTRNVSSNLVPLRKSVPAVMRGFSDMGRAAMSDAALDAKTKELIALAVGVAACCDGCIGFHAKALVRLGATEAEVHDALGVAVYMGGGPAAMYAANAVEAFGQFAAAAVSRPAAAGSS